MCVRRRGTSGFDSQEGLGKRRKVRKFVGRYPMLTIFWPTPFTTERFLSIYRQTIWQQQYTKVNVLPLLRLLLAWQTYNYTIFLVPCHLDFKSSL